MTKEELKDKISMALKDPFLKLQQGFEIICKENAELKQKLTIARTVISDLLDNQDEYARQRAFDFLDEKKE